MIGCKILSFLSFLIVIVNAASVNKQEAQTEPTVVSTTPYSFQYAVDDKETGDKKTHQETIEGGIVKGYYSMMEADGTLREVFYTADKKHGFQAIVKRTGTPNADAVQIVRHGFHKDEQKKKIKHSANKVDKDRGRITHESSERHLTSPKPSTQRIITKEPTNYQENIGDVAYQQQPQHYYPPTPQETTDSPHIPRNEATNFDKEKTTESPTQAFAHHHQPMTIVQQQFNQTLPASMEEPVEHYKISTFHGKKAHELVVNNRGQTRHKSAAQTKPSLARGKQQETQTEFRKQNVNTAENVSNSDNQTKQSENNQEHQQIDLGKATMAEEQPMYHQKPFKHHQQPQESFNNDISLNHNEYSIRITNPQSNYQFQQIIKSKDTSTVIPGIRNNEGIQFNKDPKEIEIINGGNKVYTLNQMGQQNIRSENNEEHNKRNKIQAITSEVQPIYQHQQTSPNGKTSLNNQEYYMQLLKPNTEHHFQQMNTFGGLHTVDPESEKVQVVQFERVHQDMRDTNRGNGFHTLHQMGQQNIRSVNNEEHKKINKIQAITSEVQPIQQQHQEISWDDKTSLTQNFMQLAKQNADHHFQQINKFEDLHTAIPEKEMDQQGNQNRGNRYHSMRQNGQQIIRSENGEDQRKINKIQAITREELPIQHQYQQIFSDEKTSQYQKDNILKLAKANSENHFHRINKFEDLSTVIPQSQKVQEVHSQRVHKDMRNTNRGNIVYTRNQMEHQNIRSESGEEDKKKHKIKEMTAEEQPKYQRQQTFLDAKIKLNQNDNSMQLTKPNSEHNFQQTNKFVELSTEIPASEKVQVVHFQRVHQDMRNTNRGNRVHTRNQMEHQNIRSEINEGHKKRNKIQAITAEEQPQYQHHQTSSGEDSSLNQNYYATQIAKQNAEHHFQQTNKFEDTVIPEKEKVQLVHFQRVHKDMRNTNRGNRFYTLHQMGQQNIRLENGDQHKKRNKIQAITTEEQSQQTSFDEGTSHNQNADPTQIAKHNAGQHFQQFNKFEVVSTAIPEGEIDQEGNQNRRNRFHSVHQIGQQILRSENGEEQRKINKIQAINREERPMQQHQYQQISSGGKTLFNQNDNSLQLTKPNSEHHFQQINKFEDLSSVILETEKMQVVNLERAHKDMRNSYRGNRVYTRNQMGQQSIRSEINEGHKKRNKIQATTAEEQPVYQHQQTSSGEGSSLNQNDYSTQIAKQNAEHHFQQINKFEDLSTTIPETEKNQVAHFQRVHQDMRNTNRGNKFHTMQQLGQENIGSENGEEHMKKNKIKKITAEEQPIYQHQHQQIFSDGITSLNQQDYSMQLLKHNAEHHFPQSNKFEDLSTVIPESEKVQVVNLGKDMRNTNRGNRVYTRNQMGQQNIRSEINEGHKKRNKIQATTAEEQSVYQHQQTSSGEGSSLSQNDYPTQIAKQNAEHHFQQINKFEDLSTVIPEKEKIQMVHFQRVNQDMRNTNRGNKFHTLQQMGQQKIGSENGEEHRKKNKIQAITAEDRLVYQHQQISSGNHHSSLNQNDYPTQIVKQNAEHNFQQINKFEDLSTVNPESQNVQVVHLNKVYMLNINRGNRHYRQQQLRKPQTSFENNEEHKKGNEIPVKPTEEQRTYHRELLNHQQQSHETSIYEKRLLNDNDQSIQLSKPNAGHQFRQINKFIDIPRVIPKRDKEQVVHFGKAPQDLKNNKERNRFHHKEHQKTFSTNNVDQKQIHHVKDTKTEKHPIYQHEPIIYHQQPRKTDIKLPKPKGRHRSQPKIEIVPKEILNNYEQMGQKDVTPLHEESQWTGIPQVLEDEKSHHQQKMKRFYKTVRTVLRQKDIANREANLEVILQNYQPAHNNSTMIRQRRSNVDRETTTTGQQESSRQ